MSRFGHHEDPGNYMLLALSIFGLGALLMKLIDGWINSLDRKEKVANNNTGQTASKRW